MTKIRLVMLTRRADCSLKRGKTICLNICCNKRYHIVDSKSTISSFNKWAYPFCCRAMCNSQGWMFLQGIINFSPLGSPFALLWECLKSSMSKIYYIPLYWSAAPLQRTVVLLDIVISWMRLALPFACKEEFSSLVKSGVSFSDPFTEMLIWARHQNLFPN